MKKVVLFVGVTVLVGVIAVITTSQMRNKNSLKSMQDHEDVAVQAQDFNQRHSVVQDNHQQDMRERSDENDSQKSENSEKSNERRVYIMTLPEMTQQDRERLEHDSRYGDDGFRVGMIKHIKGLFGDIDNALLEQLLEINLRGAYRFDVLYERYAYGDISQEEFFALAAKNDRIVDEEHATVLSDEQYLRYSGGVAKNAARANIFDSAQRQDGNPYDFLPKEIAQDIAEMDEMHQRAQMQVQIQADHGEITMDEALKIMEQNQRSYENYVRSILTSEQQVRFFHEDQLENESDDEDGEEIDIDSLTKEQKDALDRGESVYIPY